MSGIEITEVPIPNRPGRKATLDYPVDQLEPDSEESFYIEDTPDRSTKSLKMSVRTFAYRNGFRVIIREEADGIRVWRKRIV